MKQIYTLKMFVLAMAVTILYSCSGDTANTETTDSLIVTSDEQSNDLKQSSSIKIPSPIELYLYMRENGAKFDATILNPEENLNKYFDRKSKALNFGIYASDLAYSSVYNQNQKTFFYTKNVKTLADELGLTEGFDEEMIARVSDNINNTDSLYSITSEAYADACNFLEEQNKKDVLSYIVIGGWLESLHISISSVKKFSPDDKIVLRITEQQLLLENLMEHLGQQPKDEELQKLTTQLADLQQSFDKLYDNIDVLITAQQFKEISEKVKVIRAGIIN